ncbi:MAG: TetR/AcrR family transcriptional regulator [Thermodesulfobacteriota bacterium]
MQPVAPALLAAEIKNILEFNSMPPSRDALRSPEPVPSRRERKKERTRREIFAAALDLFAARGFDAVTIDDICTAADVARGTFFLHFPGKTALLAEYGRHMTQELAGMLDEHTGSAIAALRAAFRMLGQRAVERPEVVQLVVREVMSHPQALEQHGEQTRDFTELLAGVVRRGQRDGQLRSAADPLLAAAIAVSAYLAVVHEWARRPGDLDLEAILEDTVDLVLNGIARPPAVVRGGARKKGTR